MQKYRAKNEDAEWLADLERAGDRDSVNERMEEQTHERRAADARRNSMSFFAEMKMRHKRVLTEMHEQKSGEYHHRRLASAGDDRFGNNVGDGNRNQHSGRKRNHQLERTTAPPTTDGDGRRADQVRAGRGDGIENGGHVPRSA